jgi:WD40 repeat protein
MKTPQMTIEHILTVHDNKISSLAWNPQVSNQFASADVDCSVHLWQVGKSTPSTSYKLSNCPIQIGYNPFDGNQLYVLFDEGNSPFAAT